MSAPGEASFPLGEPGKIAFFRSEGVLADLWLMNPDGSAQLDLTNTGGSVYESEPSFSPDARRVAFVRNSGIWVIGIDGSNATNLTNSFATEEQNPDFSPDGRRIAYASFTADGYSDILEVNLDGSRITPITQTPGVTEVQPSYSPDGRRIAFTKSVGGPDIWVMNADGSGAAPLTSGSTVDVDPSFSHDGKRIAFRRDGDIWVMNADGSGAVRLTNTLGVANQEASPIFSADDKRIVYALFNGMQGEVLTIKPDGSGGPANLTNTPCPVSELAPDWEYVYACGGQRATIVGTDSAEILKGTKRADVIVGNGGNDKLVGRGGKDRICGGAGNDKLKGGADNDRLFGGAGKDKLAGAKGTDRCSGGKGRDKGTACEKGKV